MTKKQAMTTLRVLRTHLFDMADDAARIESAIKAVPEQVLDLRKDIGLASDFIERLWERRRRRK